MVSVWVYIPASQEGMIDLRLLNTYPPEDESSWSVFMGFAIDADGDPIVDALCGIDDEGDQLGATLWATADEWKEVTIEIDLDYDWAILYYDGEIVCEHLWSTYGGPMRLGAIQLYAFDPALSVYYDDFRIFRVEECDDANRTNEDGCSTTCRLE